MEPCDDTSSISRSQETSKSSLRDHPNDGEKPRFAGLYREDVVRSVAQPGFLGLVAKVAGDSDSDSSDSEDEDENDAEDDSLSEGFARVCWGNSEESTHKIEDIQVVDRSFLHGDIVAKVSSPMGQTGVVTNVDLKVDLQLPNGEVLTGVDSRTIKRVRSFVIGDYVIHGHWLGRVDEISDNVTVMFEDGAKCKVSNADPDRLVPLSVSPMDDSECPYYPGQKVKACFTGTLKSARWIKGSWKPTRTEGTVVDVEVDSVLVFWMAAASTNHTPQAPGFPAERQSPKNLRRLMNFSYTTWQLGDRALLPQRLARNSPMVASPSVQAEVHSDNEAEAGENHEQAQSSECLEAERPAPSDSKDAATDSWVAYRRKLRRRFPKQKKKAMKKEDFFETALLIVGTKTKVDILWQDGSREKGVDACTLFPVDHVGDHDFWPEQHVMVKGSDFEGAELNTTRRSGIVKSVDYKQRTAKVRWLLPTSHPQKLPCFETEETVSVYELIQHPDFDYCLGDVVIKLSSTVDIVPEAMSTSVTMSSNDADTKVETMESSLAEEDNTQTEAHANVEKETNSADFSWVGIILGIEDGQIQVGWADGEVSKVGYQAIFVVGRDEDDGSSQASAIEIDEEIDDAGSWTTVDSREMNDVVEGEQELGQSDSVNSLSEKLDECNGPEGSLSEVNSSTSTNQSVPHGSEKGLGISLTLPFSALIRALKFAASLLWVLRGRKRNVVSDHNGTSSKVCGREEQLGSSNHSSGERLTRDPFCAATGKADTCEGSSSPPSGETLDDNAISCVEDAQHDTCSEEPSLGALPDTTSLTIAPLDGGETPVLNAFKQFDIVKDIADHRFGFEVCQPSNQRRWSKKVQQEWVMLEKCLPDTIYVRVYEDRMDLLRSVIVGAAGTPYHDGLFFFDLFLPSEYPSSPPLVHYHSGGLRLNPNLYENGKVCLSLLNTWTGKGNEVWHSSSSILQVLVSIQGLVLNANPYFNEAGYDKQMGTPEGERNSLAYMENSFLLSCRSMLYIIRKPPKHFEDFVQMHFKHRGARILQACLAYMQGASVGSLSDDGMVSPSGGKDIEPSTAGFRLMLSKIVPRLISSFKEVGANCKPYEHQFNAIGEAVH